MVAFNIDEIVNHTTLTNEEKEDIKEYINHSTSNYKERFSEEDKEN